jgi:predicted MFS family arabinose efflux permease
VSERLRESSSGGRDLRIVLALSCAPLIGLALARFAYALLLPDMRADLHWTFAVAGAVQTANAVGYLLGAIAAAPLARRIGSRRALLASLAVVVAGLIVSAASGELAVVFAVRVVVGFAGATSFVIGGGLAAAVGRSHSRRFATMLLAFYFAGSGLGIVASGVAVPIALSRFSIGDGWRIGWLALGTMALILLLSVSRVIVRAPEPEAIGERPLSGRNGLGFVSAAYFLYGTGYIAYMTFIVAYLAARGAAPVSIAVFWVVLGVSSVAATFVWGPLLGRMRGGTGTAIVIGVVAVGAFLPVISGSPVFEFASAVVFGGSFLSVVTAVTAAARESLPPHRWTAAIGSLTVAFAIGQCLGPVLTGIIADHPGGVTIGLVVSAGLIALGALAALGHRK